MECLAIFHFIDKKSPDTILETPCQCQHWQSMVAPGEHAVIKGSERITSWQHVEGNVWKVVLPNSFFGNARSSAPTAGPIEGLKAGQNKIKLW